MVEITPASQNTMPTPQVWGTIYKFTPKPQQQATGKYFTGMSLDEEKRLAQLVNQKYPDLSPEEKSAKFMKIWQSVTWGKPQQQQPQKQGFWDFMRESLNQFTQPARQFIWWAASGVPSFIWNTAWAIVEWWKAIWQWLNAIDRAVTWQNVQTPQWLENVWTDIIDAWEQAKEGIQQAFWEDVPWAAFTKWWELATDIWLSLVWMKDPSAWALTLKWVWQRALKWGIEWARYSVGQEWQIDPKEVWLWALFEVVIPAWAEIAKETRQLLKWWKPEKMLLQAMNPRYNTLSRGKNVKEILNKAKRADEIIVEQWLIPKNTSERVLAHKTAMENVRNQIESKMEGVKWIKTIDFNQVAKSMKDYVTKNPALKDQNPTEYQKVLDLIDIQKKLWNKSVVYGENVNQIWNSTINNWGDQKVSDFVMNAMKAWKKSLTDQMDEVLSRVPWEFSNLKKDYWALSSTYQDVIKSDIQNLRKKWLWLTETYSRIEWLWDIIWSLGWIIWWNNPIPWLAKWAAKLAIWKQLQKLRDPDYLIEAWFKVLNEIKKAQ